MAGEPDNVTLAPSRSSRLPAIISAFCLTLTALFLHERLIVLRDIENYLVDYRLRHGRMTPPNPGLVHVSVDKTSYAGDFPDAVVRNGNPDEQYFMTLLRGEWPWTREVWTFVAERLMKAGSKGVLLGFIFPSEKPEDAELKAVLDRHSPRVVIGALVDQADRSTSLIAPSPSLITPDATGDTLNDPRVGVLNVHTDRDGVVRRGLYLLRLNEFLGLPPEIAAEIPPLPTAVARAATIIKPDATPPSGQLLRFTGPPGTFPAVSLKRLIDPDEWRTQFADTDFFRDKFVVIGPGSAVLNDFHRTPFTDHGASMAGPELLLHQINAAVRNEFSTESSTREERVVIAGAGVVLLFLTLFPRGPRLPAIVCATLSAAFLGITFWLSSEHNHMVTAVFTPLALLNGGLLAHLMFLRQRQPHAPAPMSAP